MTEDKINRKNLWRQLSKIKKKKVWIIAGKKLGLEVTQPKGGSSHFALRLPGYEKTDIKGLVSVVNDPMRKDISEKVFKRMIDKGFDEDDIWKALNML